jgi:hypothetical protein
VDAGAAMAVTRYRVHFEMRLRLADGPWSKWEPWYWTYTDEEFAVTVAEIMGEGRYDSEQCQHRGVYLEKLGTDEQS